MYCYSNVRVKDHTLLSPSKFLVKVVSGTYLSPFLAGADSIFTNIAGRVLRRHMTSTLGVDVTVAMVTTASDI